MFSSVKILLGKVLCSVVKNNFLNCDLCINPVQLLLIFKAEPNVQDDNGNTPLHYAVLSNNIKAVQLLLKYGADPNIQNSFGNTPLHCATSNNNTIIVELLCKYKADFSVKNNDQVTPARTVILGCNSDIVKLINPRNKLSKDLNDVSIKSIQTHPTCAYPLDC